MGSNYSRNKGHSYERTLAERFRTVFGFTKCKTSRQASRLLDDCKVDLAFTKGFLIQAKSGYVNNRPKPDIIFSEMRRLLKEHYEDDSPEFTYDPILFHKLDTKGEFVTMEYALFEKLFKKYREK